MSIRKGKHFPFGSKIKGTKISRNCPIESLPEQSKLYISMSQHIGAPSIPVVKVGDQVKKGQIIGEACGAISANVYSPISGTVCAIEDLLNGLGQKQKYIIIENDYQNNQVFFDDMLSYDAQSIIERIRLAGIVGLGGAGFPTAVKLSPKNKLDCLIINGAECEPYLTCDFRLMIEKTNEIYKGIKYVATALNIKRIIIGIEVNKPEAIEAFSNFNDIEVVKLKKQYPMGSEKHLIYCTTGRKVPIGKMPFDVGCCVQNIKTMVACYQAIELNTPLIETVVTVSGKGLNNPKNIRTPLGASFSSLIEFAGGKKEDVIKIISGGPMMGKSLVNLNQFVRKTDSGILCITEKETNLSKPTNCINCAICAKNCPMRLMPMYIESYALANDFVNAEKYGAMNCMECGLCSYNCPATRALVQSISMAKTKIKEIKSNGK